MLNTEQKIAKDRLISYLNSTTENRIILTGSGGVGKTFTISQVMSDLDKLLKLSAVIDSTKVSKRPWFFTATTNKAKQAIQRCLPYQEVDTIHSLLGLRPYRGHLTKSKNFTSKLSPGSILVIDECFDQETEVLTDNGFKLFSHLTPTDLVAQYNPENTEITYAKPLRHIVKDYEGDMVTVSGSTVNFSVTPNHDMLLYQRSVQGKQEKTYKRKAKNISCNSYTETIHSGKGVGQKHSLTVDDKLAIAFQADGHLQHIYAEEHPANIQQVALNMYNEHYKSGHCTVVFSFAKKAKIDLFVKSFGHLPTMRINYPSSTHKTSISLANIDPNRIDKDLSKLFKASDFSQEGAKQFIDYLINWDGFKLVSGFGYSNTNKASVDFVQELAVMAGYLTNLLTCEDDRSEKFNTCYKLHMYPTLTKSTQALSKTLSKDTYYKGKVYCVEMPLGTVVTRRKGKVLIAGNCSYIDDKLLSFIDELVPKSVKVIYVGDANQLTPVKSTTCPVFHQGYEELKLTTLVRQTNAPLIGELSSEFKEYIESDGKLDFPKISLSNEISHMSSQDFNALIEKVFIQDNGLTLHNRVLAGTNAVVNKHNTHLFGLANGRTELVAGDTVVSNNFVKGIKTDEEVIILSKSPYLSSIANCNGTVFSIQSMTHSTDVYVPDSHKKASKIISDILDAPESLDKAEALELYTAMADLRPMYASTIHKSQGSTFENVYIDLGSLSYVRDKIALARLLYVAISRASKHVYLTGDIS